MGKYTGLVFRGGYYGNAPRLVLNAEPMEAVALDYGKIRVYWNPPAGSFTKIRLVRNNDNFPEGEEDGIILWEQSSTTSLSGVVERADFIDGQDNYIDGNLDNDLPITPGQYIYYAIFMFTTANVWIPGGYASTLMPKDRGSQATMFNLIPRVFTTEESSPTDIPSPNTFLYTFLKGFSFTFDQLLTQAELVQPSYGKRRTPPQLLPLTENHLGLYPERGLPYRNQKKLIREGAYLFKTKGTKLGIQNYLESLTGYNPTVTVSPNLILDVQDSSFTTNKGRWISTYGTLTAVSNKPAPSGTNAVDTTWSGRMVTAASVVSFKYRLNNVATLTTSAAHGLVVGDTVNVTGVDSSFNGNGFTVATVPTPTTFTYANSGSNLTPATAATGSVSNTSSISLGRDNPVLNGIPVIEGTSYKFSYYAASDSNGNLIADVFWYNYLGQQIASPIQGTGYGTTGVYQRIEQTLTAPTGAVYAGLRIVFTTQNSYNIDLIQFAPAATATSFDEARGLDIFLEAKKVNICSNPSFEVDTNTWTTNSTKTRVTDVPAGTPGTYSMKLSGQSTLNVSKILNTTPVTYKLTEGNFYILSAYIKATSAVSLTMSLTADDDDGPDSDIATKTINVTSSWARYDISLFIPEGLSTNGNITATFNLSGSVSSREVWIDNVQFEKGYKATDYFDGSLPVVSGVFWSGTAHASYSYNYQGRTVKVPRVLYTLNDWVPYKLPWRLRSYKGLEGDSNTIPS